MNENAVSLTDSLTVLFTKLSREDPRERTTGDRQNGVIKLGEKKICFRAQNVASQKTTYHVWGRAGTMHNSSVFALHSANLASTPSVSYGPLNTAGHVPESPNKQKTWNLAWGANLGLNFCTACRDFFMDFPRSFSHRCQAPFCIDAKYTQSQFRKGWGTMGKLSRWWNYSLTLRHIKLLGHIKCKLFQITISWDKTLFHNCIIDKMYHFFNLWRSKALCGRKEWEVSRFEISLALEVAPSWWVFVDLKWEV